MSEAWSHEEVEAAVADYFAMLAKELSGEPYSKADHNRQLQNLLSSRTRGSVERKHQNISAVLIDLGYPYIDGFEVKTTRFGALTPFFASRNEVEFSEERHGDYQLYRLFNYRAQPRLFTLAGLLRASCELEPFNYSAVPN